MDHILLILVFIGGVLFGLLITLLLWMWQGKSGEKIAREIFDANESKLRNSEEKLFKAVENSFGKLSADALSKSSDQFLKLAELKLSDKTTQHAAELDGKKKLIDQQLTTMSEELGKVTTLVKDLESERSKQYGALGEQLTSLGQTSALLQQALADNRTRGQWGERMAEDILRLAGFEEGINYRKQQTMADGNRPDFTFLLPKNLCLNMDVKFPLGKYVDYQNATTEVDRAKYQSDFLKDVRSRIAEVTKRGYIDPTQSTVDCVLIFIPNEQIYRFIHEVDDEIINDALSQKVILCSPLTLFTVLAIIHQASDNFAMERSSHEILKLLGDFRKQWDLFVKKMNDVGRHVDLMSRAYDELVGTRTNMLEKQLRNIGDLMTKYNLDGGENGTFALGNGIPLTEESVIATMETSPSVEVDESVSG